MTKFVQHTNCPSCGSKDNLAVYDNDTATCFGCGHWERTRGTEVDQKPVNNYFTKVTVEEVLTYPVAKQPRRKVSEEVYSHLGIRMSVNSSTGLPDTIYYPGYIKDELAGFKVRKLPKDFKQSAVGSTSGVDPFGWLQLSNERKKLIIVEGEEDVAAVKQMLYNHVGKKFPGQVQVRFADVVSPPMGVKSLRDMIEKKEQDILEYAEIVFIPDQDKEKTEAITTVAQFIPVNKLRIIELPLKDSSEMLQAGREEEWVSLFLSAKQYRPKSILNIADTLPMILDYKVTKCYDYPPTWKKFNYFTLGRRMGELDILTAGTGAGKSFVIKEILHYDINSNGLKSGIISLEESPRDTIVGLMSLDANKRLLDPAVAKGTTDEEFTGYWKKIANTDNLQIVNHDGTMTESEVLLNVTYLATSYGCKFIYVDNLGNILPNKRSSDKYEATGEFLEKLRGLALKLDVWICLVVHLRKNGFGARAFESGAVATESDLLGTSMLKQKAYCVWFVQRNKHHSDPHMRNVARLHVLKCRFLGSGRTGATDFLHFDDTTGRLSVIPEPEKDIIEPLESQSTGIDI